MKQITLIALTLLSIESFAQKVTQKIILNKGQKINVSQVDNTNLTLNVMGQEINITGSNNTTSLLEVKSVADNNTVVSSTLKMVKISSEAMGNSQTYDSENDADRNSEIGKQFEGKLNKTEDFVVDNEGNEVNNSKKTEGAGSTTANPMEDMLKMTSAASNISSAFILVPTNAKAGYSWSDSSTVDKIKSIKKYTIKNIENNNAVITVASLVTGEKSIEMQGQEMNVNINAKTDGEITSDITTGLIKKNTLVTEINNTMDMMGSSSPMTGKVNTTITYTPVQ